jgi:two-component sensor histidine kinase
MSWRSRIYGRPIKLLRHGMLLVAAIIAVIWAWQAWSHKYAAQVDASRQNAALISEYVLRSVQSQVLLLNQIDQILAEHPEIEPEALHRWLRVLDASSGHSTSLGVIAADGQVVAGSRTFPLNANFAEREYFKAMREGTVALFVERLRQYPTNRDTLTIARRLPGQDFRGIITASTDVRQFTDFLQGISISPEETAFLMRSDGVLLARPDPNEPPFRARPDGPAMAAITRADAGLFDAGDRMDGVTRTYAFKRIGDLPVFAIHGASLAGITQAVATDMIPVVIFLILSATLGYLALTGVARRVEAERARDAAAFDRRLLEEARQRAALKETLLKEMSHRIHNNLQTVQALIQLRRRNPGEPGEMLEEIGQRVWAISEVHNLLYGGAEDSRLDLAAFLRTMVNNPSIVPPEQAIAVNCQADKVELDLRQAVPAALIVMECLTNALKHAFPGERRGVVEIALRQVGAEAEVVIADDGIGMPEIRSRHSGMRLTQSLAAQLRGHIDYAPRLGGGTIITLRFPLALAEDMPAIADKAAPSVARPAAAAW